MKTVAVWFLLAALRATGADPSMLPASDITGQKKFVERYRVVVDLDGDSKDDLILSDGPHTFGNSGGSWTVYFRRGDSFEKSGEIFAHPKAVAIEPDRDRSLQDPKLRRFVRIWVYLRGGAGAGSFGYYRIGETTVDQLQKLEIYLGNHEPDMGTEIYKATFERSPIPFALEHSSTDEQGKVTWAADK